MNTVNNFGHIANRGTGPYSSLGTGKYDADDNFRLVQFDSSLPPDGNWKAITGLQDVPDEHEPASATRRNSGSARSASTSVIASSTRVPTASSSIGQSTSVAHEEHALVEADDDRAVGRAIGERGQRRRMDDGERPHLARARRRRPTRDSVAPQRAHTGPGRVPERAARRAALDPQLAVAERRPERARRRRSAGSGRGIASPVAHRSTPSSTAPDGSLIAPHTNATSAPAT